MPNSPQSTDLDSPDARLARAAESGSEGIRGASPSNTAPYNCNFTYQPLRWGIDSLYLSYPGTLSPEKEIELRELKKLAQGPDHEASHAQIQLGNHFFEVKDKSSGLFVFTLVDHAFMIRLSAGKSKKVPMAYVKVSSRLLSHMAPQEIENEIRGILRSLGEVLSPKVSRVDLFLDFASDLNMESWRRDAWVTRAKAVAQYAEDIDFTGWTIGAGSSMSARLYQKVIESKKSGNEYLHDVWKTTGWDGVQPVWRMEFQYKREVLDQLGLISLPEILAHQDGLWSYATADWLRLCIPNANDKTRARWPIHPLWLAISGLDWKVSGGPLTRNYPASRAPSMEWLGSRCASALASIAAVSSITDFETAANEAKYQAWAALDIKNGLSGISVDQFFREKVEGLTREYNIRMNPKLPKKPVAPPGRNEYERQSRG
jgi:hypothetical protein